jgi:hypothetical protein
MPLHVPQWLKKRGRRATHNASTHADALSPAVQPLRPTIEKSATSSTFGSHSSHTLTERPTARYKSSSGFSTVESSTTVHSTVAYHPGDSALNQNDVEKHQISDDQLKQSGTQEQSEQKPGLKLSTVVVGALGISYDIFTEAASIFPPAKVALSMLNVALNNYTVSTLFASRDPIN